MKVGTIVKRIIKDNYPVAKVGDIGVVCAENDITIRLYGPMNKLPNMTLVSFGGNVASPNITVFLKKVEENNVS